MTTRFRNVIAVAPVGILIGLMAACGSDASGPTDAYAAVAGTYSLQGFVDFSGARGLPLGANGLLITSGTEVLNRDHSYVETWNDSPWGDTTPLNLVPPPTANIETGTFELGPAAEITFRAASGAHRSGQTYSGTVGSGVIGVHWGQWTLLYTMPGL